MYQSFPQKHISQSTNAMPVFKEQQKKEKRPEICEEKKEKIILKDEKEKKDKNPSFDFLNKMSIDDIIIIGLIILLIYEGSEDYLTIGLLAAVLLF